MIFGAMKFFNGSVSKILLLTLLLSSCMPNLSNTLRKRTTATTTDTTAGVGQGYILADNPIILAGDPTMDPNTNLNALLSIANITTDPFLIGTNYCYNTNNAGNCLDVRADNTQASALNTPNGKWTYDANSSEFLQVNSYYHVSKILKQFFNDLNLSYGMAYNGLTPWTDSALPLSIEQGNGQFQFIIDSPLATYANCSDPDNASFSAATNSLCFGYMTNYPNMKWAQDSSAIYHETGHFIQYLLLNLNNTNIPFKTNLDLKKPTMGNFHYDESGSIGEGLSDFFSYYINQRTHFSEWGAGRVLNASRPISEDDTLHIPALAKDPNRRLSYPEFIDYDPNNHTIPSEDIHLSGMIMSHFLVAFTEDIMEKCSMTKRDAQSITFSYIAETMAELGDLNSKGTKKGSAGRINLNSTYAYDWLMKVNPINYRNFSQTFAKNVLHSLGNASLGRCNGGIYTRDSLETLLDEYGLLLFRTYNENRNNSIYGDPIYQNTPVSSLNRNKSVLIAKDLIKLDPTVGSSTAYIIDKQSVISAGLASLKSAGLIGSTSEITPTDLGFNNGNGKVSPGEVVGIGLNLYNNSNSTMGGVQILANDWKNLDDNGKPCIFSSNIANDANWTTEAEGGGLCADDSVKADSSADFQPICVFQYNGANSTAWVSQHTFRNKISLDSSFCLNNKDDRDCFMRAIKGADQANLSKLNPKKNWYQTMQDPTKDTAYTLDWGNVILFEISKHIPPGTVVDCRFRVRFTNCEDCYHDSATKYDFKDFEFNGPKPFKTIHLQMTIID
jgi:hypothetical protein